MSIVNHLRVPFGVRFKGVCLVPNPAGDVELWANVYINWQWETWLKPQIDTCVALGANAIRLIGDVRAILSNAITRQTYLAQWGQLIDYCQSIGVLVYPGGMDWRHLPDGWFAAMDQTRIDLIRDELVAAAAFFDTKPNVIGMEVINESWSGWPSFVTDLDATHQYFFTAIRNACNMPLTVTDNGSTGVGFGSFAKPTYCDFYDAHIYSVPSSANVDTCVASCGEKPLIIGEMGSALSRGASRITDYAAFLDTTNNLNPQFYGTFIWAANDQNTVSNDQWGLFDSSWNPYSNITPYFQQFLSARPRNISPGGRR